MLIVISPAKTLDFESPIKTKFKKLEISQPIFLKESRKLIKQLQPLSPIDISELMHISDNLGELNFQRYLNWHTPFTTENARQSIFAFKGDVYTGLAVEDYSAADLKFAQNHLQILSGLYGTLRPLDLIQAYRLEMGVKFNHSEGRNLYEFWGRKITDSLNKALKKQQDKVLINLASNEYFKSVKSKELGANIITPVFKDYKNGQYKVISFLAKKARGLMTSYIIQNRLSNIEDLKSFNTTLVTPNSTGKYRYSAKESSTEQWVFLRKAA